MSIVLHSAEKDLELRTEGKSSFAQEEFESYVDKEVEVTGIEVEGTIFFVRKIGVAAGGGQQT